MAIDFAAHREDLLFLPLGGTNEIGVNVNLYHYKGKWLMVDCGGGFADDYLPGVDLLVADLSFVKKNIKNLVGLVLTHAHEDHLGGIQYLWNYLKCPIYDFEKVFKLNLINMINIKTLYIPKHNEVDKDGWIIKDSNGNLRTFQKYTTFVDSFYAMKQQWK